MKKVLKRAESRMAALWDPIPDSNSHARRTGSVYDKSRLWDIQKKQNDLAEARTSHIRQLSL